MSSVSGLSPQVSQSRGNSQKRRQQPSDEAIRDDTGTVGLPLRPTSVNNQDLPMESTTIRESLMVVALHNAVQAHVSTDLAVAKSREAGKSALTLRMRPRVYSRI